jgi:hypothetical protein
LSVSDFSGIKLSASLIAWDPIKQKKAWEVPMSGLWNGGTLVSAGNLVFHGNATGEFAAYDALTGAKLWSMNAGLGIVGAPITYELDGRQYVAVLVGWGGALPGAFGAGVAQHGWRYGAQPRRLLVFALGAHETLQIVPGSRSTRRRLTQAMYCSIPAVIYATGSPPSAAVLRRICGRRIWRSIRKPSRAWSRTGCSNRGACRVSESLPTIRCKAFTGTSGSARVPTGSNCHIERIIIGV